MDRTEFLRMVQECSMLKGEINNLKQNVPDELRVRNNGIEYYPVGYRLMFDNRGQAIHTAILHDLSWNSVTECELIRVERVSEV